MNRPGFVDTIGIAYRQKGKSVILLTGDVLDIFGRGRDYLRLDQLLYQELKDKFLVLRVDAATGIDCYTREGETELQRTVELADVTAPPEEQIGNVRKALDGCRHQPLPTLVALKAISDGVTRARRAATAGVKPVCAVIQFAGSIFPAGDFDRLSELDRQRLVFFLNWITSPFFVENDNLLLLVADGRSEINAKILTVPSVEPIEVELPNAEDRGRFVKTFTENKPDIQFDFPQGSQDLIEESAGLRLTHLRDLLEVAARMKAPVSRQEVLKEVNTALERELGDIVKVVRPSHTPQDVVGHAKSKEILENIFRRCEDPETAVSAVLVSGPNGGGKTFQLEAFAAQSGRIVIELTGLRGMYFGQTDRFFEQLRWRIQTYGKILILVDEAHTAFGSVHRGDVHETEKRLAGNLIKMMGDPDMLGKVVWAMMTSRPDELDPDIKSRSPIQIPIFDAEGEDRKTFVRELFRRKKLEVPDADLDELLRRTEHYSARDFNFLVREVRAAKKPVLEVLNTWQASSSIAQQRRLQTLIASQHCSYPELLPSWLRELPAGDIEREIQHLKLLLMS